MSVVGWVWLASGLVLRYTTVSVARENVAAISSRNTATAVASASSLGLHFLRGVVIADLNRELAAFEALLNISEKPLRV